ncbi:hypothetical protein [Nocardia tengchongensis]|uniref:hypothetical protein n=1 Tax=Nocardia tengchongensis TaxID=2055889 RepID=UPI0036629A96
MTVELRVTGLAEHLTPGEIDDSLRALAILWSEDSDSDVPLSDAERAIAEKVLSLYANMIDPYDIEDDTVPAPAATALTATEEDESEFRVVWEIDVHAGSPQKAARAAAGHQRAPGTWATVYDVIALDGTITRVDLLELEEDLVTAAPTPLALEDLIDLGPADYAVTDDDPEELR